MKLSFLLELLFIFIIIAFAASKPLNSDLRLRTIKSGLVARQEFSPQSPASNVDDDDDDDDDDSFGLGDDDDDDEDDDDDDDDESGLKKKEPQDADKPAAVDSDEDDDILDFEDEKDVSSEEDDVDGEELLLFGDELFGFLTEDDEPNPIPSSAAVTASAIQSNLVNQPAAEALPGNVNKNKPIQATASLPPQASGPLLPSFANDALQPIIPQSNHAHTPALLELSQTAQSDLVNGDLNNIKPSQTASVLLPQISEPVLPSSAGVLKPIIPESNFAHSPALLELSQIAESDVIDGDDIKNNNIPQTEDSHLEFIANTAASSESNSQSETSIEVIKAEGAQDFNDESLEEEGMIVVSDATLAENNKNPQNEQIITNTDIKHNIANTESKPASFQNDKDMEIVGQIHEIAQKLPSTSTAVSTKPPKNEDAEEGGLLGLVDSLISDEDIEDDDDDDDDDTKIEDESDKEEEEDDDDDDDEDNEIAALEEATSEGNNRKDKNKKKKKSPGVINRIGQTLGLVRSLKNKELMSP